MGAWVIDNSLRGIDHYVSHMIKNITVLFTQGQRCFNSALLDGGHLTRSWAVML